MIKKLSDYKMVTIHIKDTPVICIFDEDLLNSDPAVNDFPQQEKDLLLWGKPTDTIECAIVWWIDDKTIVILNDPDLPKVLKNERDNGWHQNQTVNKS